MFRSVSNSLAAAAGAAALKSIVPASVSTNAIRLVAANKDTAVPSLGAALGRGYGSAVLGHGYGLLPCWGTAGRMALRALGRSCVAWEQQYNAIAIGVCD